MSRRRVLRAVAAASAARRRVASLSLLCVALGIACGHRGARTGPADAELSIHATVTGTPIDLLVLEVTAPDLPAGLLFNLRVDGGTASGTILVPPGPARTVAGRGFDSDGMVTHEGAITLDVLPGRNPAVSFALVPRPGLVEVTVWIGSVTITVAPASAVLAPGETVQLVATVQDPGGQVLPLQVTWAVAPPAVATASASGVVTAVAPGVAQVFALYGGVAAAASVTVVALPPAAAPTITPASGVYASARTVTIASTVSGATLRYTLDGTSPTSTSPVYTAPFTVSATSVVKAFAHAPGYSESRISTAIYVIESSGTLNGHAIVVDGGDLLLSWLPQDYAYAAAVERTWSSMLRLPSGTGGRSVMWLYPYVLPGTHAVPYWPNAPGSAFAMLADSAILSYPFTGDPRPMAAVKAWLDHYLANGLTLPSDSWASVPYNEGDPGSLAYRGANDTWGAGVGDGTGVLEPDKVAELGHAFLLWYEWDGTIAYRDAALRCADALVAHRRTSTGASVSPWPFRVRADTGAVRESYTAHVIAAIRLFDELVRLGLGDTVAYQAARDAAWSWVVMYPMVNGAWCQYFEDVGIQGTYDANTNQLLPGNTARYLLEHPQLDPEWLSHAQALIRWIETHFGKPLVNGARPIGEQSVYGHAMGSHTSRYAAINALLYERTGDPAAKEKAFRALNWATYMNRADGDTVDGWPTPNQIWMTDGFGDYIRHFMIAMGATPEWAPPGEDHLIRSTSVVQSVAYERGRVTYRTFDAAAEEVLRLTFTPSAISADGVALPSRTVPTGEGWSWDAATRVLRVRHDAGREIVVR